MAETLHPEPNKPHLSDSDPPLPSKIGKYRVLAKLGQGGMAIVHLAASMGPSGFSKLLVLKTLRHGLAQDPQSVQSFLKEAKIAARLNHPNVVQTFEVLQVERTHMIVMEYLEGAPLALLRKKQNRDGMPILSLAAHLTIIMDALAGLEHAHNLRDFSGTVLEVVHRDVSPNNIFVTFDGIAKLLDFGIARAANQQHTNTGPVKGTMRYLAPESIIGQGVDRRADIFAAGVLIWEAATGARIWDGQTDVSVMHHIVNGQFPSARETNPNVPEELDAICRRAMSFDRNKRHQTAEELRKELQDFVAKRGELDEGRARLVPLMNEAMGEEVAKRRRRIDAQLAKLEKIAASEDSESLPVITLDGTSGATGDVTRRKANQKRTLLFAVVGAVMFAVGAAAFWTTTSTSSSRSLVSNDNTNEETGREQSRGAGSEPAPANNERTAQTKNDTIEIRLRAVPTNAVLYLGNERLATNPAVLTRPRDRSERFFRAEAPGHLPGLLNLRMDNNIDVMLVLNETPTAAQRAAAGVAERTAPSRPAPSRTKGRSKQPPAEVAEPAPRVETRPSGPTKATLDNSNPWAQ